MIYLLAFVTGLLGSMHCVGMCGPIVLALPVGGLTSKKVWLSRGIYQTGRTMAYTLLGLLPGLLGEAISFAGFQQKLSVLAGFTLLIAAFAPRVLQFNMHLPFAGTVKKRLGMIWQSKSSGTFLFAGFFNGFLPCGFVYLALAGSLASGTVWGAMVYMFAFGLGTWPAMLGISWVWGWATASFRHQVLKFAPVFTFVLGLLFILRGLNLQVGMLSPGEKSVHGKKEIVCCKKAN